MQPISPNYNWENGVKQIKITEKNLSQSCILCQLLRTKILSSGSKCIKHFFLFLQLFAISLKEFSTKIKSWKLVQCPLTCTYQVGYIQYFRDPSNIICLWSVNQCMLHVHSRLLEWVLTYYTISVVTEGYWLWVDFKPYFRIIAVVFWCVFAHWESIEFLYLMNFSCISVCFDEFVF